MRELEYPFDSEYLYHKKKSIKKELLEQLDEKSCLHKNSDSGRFHHEGH